MSIVPADKVPVIRDPDEVRAAYMAAYLTDRRFMAVPPIMARLSDDELRAHLVCYRRESYPQSDAADEVSAIVVFSDEMSTFYPPGESAGAVDPGCVALETRKLQEYRG